MLGKDGSTPPIREDERLDVSRGHFLALLCATLAGVGTTLAMGHIVPATFLATGTAGFRADAANGLGEVRSTGHQSRCRIAQLRTVAIQCDTSDHDPDV